MLHIILHTLEDTLKTMPILFLVYLLIEFLQSRVVTTQAVHKKFGVLGPFFGALVGCVPQCGFSTASAMLYNKKMLGAGTLIAVFLATSDEAIPILLSNLSQFDTVLYLIICKIIIAVIAGYFFQYIVFRKERFSQNAASGTVERHCDAHCHHTYSSVLKNALMHTIKISLFIVVTLFAINVMIHFIGEDNLQKFLLSNSVFQPALTALIGLIPGCATSVLITELLINGTISFGAAVAGLSTGAGFGYIILCKDSQNKKEAVKIIFCTYLAGALAGMLIQLWM